MDFRTELVVPPAEWNLALHDRLITIGSCFSDTIGQQLLSNKFSVTVNPFGTTYHPIAIDRLIGYATYQKYPPEDSYLINQEHAFNYDFHSSFWNSTTENLRLDIEEMINTVHQQIKESRCLLITYGTAWLFERTDNGQGVANCHRMPSGGFRRRLASVDEMITSFQKMHGALRSINPGIKIILTVSPVRHLKDTLPSNSVSKATLRLACHQLTSFENVDYFPAYELLLDDLRDYRFYADDLIHPSAFAEEYIWTKFAETYFTKDTLRILSSWRQVRQSLAHKPFHPGSEAHQEFIRQTLGKLEQLSPVLDVEKEMTDLRDQLKLPSVS